VDGEKVEDIETTLTTDGENLLKVGKRRFAKVKFRKK